MIAILHLIFFTCAIVLSFRSAISEGMLLESIGKYAEGKIEQGYKWHNIYSCPFCFPTIATFLGWIFMFGLNVVPFEFDKQLIFIHLIAYFSSSFIAGFSWTAYTTLNAIREKNQEEKEYLENLNGDNGITQ